MNSLRVFAVSALFIGTMSVFSACGSDDDDGAGGKKGTGGKDSGLGGSGGVGGTGATGGSGGVGLSGGSGGTTGGTGGTTGGTGGVAGGGGSAGATGGAAGGGGTAGGAAGSAGSAGASGGSAGSGPDAAAFGVCKETCTTSADCGTGNVCQLGACHAANTFSEKCSADADCIAEASAWTVPCTSTANCSANFVCVDTGGGVGKCAALSSAPFCVIQPATFDMPKIDGTGNIEVCGDNAGLLCHPVKKTCETPCAAAIPDCVAHPSLKACVNGFCGCGSNANCASGYCDTATGICGCDASTDCPSSNPTCSGNKCGCNGVGECTKQFTGTTLSCN
jgi:hypothetical protein